jgi:hypothetical protein
MPTANLFTPVLKAKGVRIQLEPSGSSHTAPVFHLPANAYPVGFYGRVVTAFAGLTHPTVELGILGDTELYIQKHPINKVSELIPGHDTSGGGAQAKAGYCARLEHEMISTSAKDIIATFRVGSGSLTTLTAGEVEFVMVYIDVSGTNL